MEDKDLEIDPDGSTESSTWPLSAGDSDNVYFFNRFNEFEWDLHPPDQTCFEEKPISSDPLAPNCSGTSTTNLTSSGPHTHNFESFKAEDEFDVVGEPSKARKGGLASTSSSEDPPEKSMAEPSTSISACKSTKSKGEKRMRQPRFAFMTKSEVDHLEDGFRWRKYGQKAVKNSPFPRSYYRCTNSKCTVKKRVERSFEDPTIVITTYEGQHCHHSIGFPRGGVIGHEAPISANNFTNSSSGHNFPHSGMALRQVANAQLSQVAVLEATRASATLPLSKPIPRRPPPNEGLLGDIVPGMSNRIP